jgi:hypothetical protein
MNMGMSEVADRSRQEASKWLDRNRGRAALPPGLLDAMDDGSALKREALSVARPGLAPALRLDDFQRKGPERFFAGATHDETAALFETLAPAALTRTLALSAGVLVRSFDLLGYRGLWFGDPVVWSLDPVSGRRSPFVHWTSIDLTEPASTGDCKVVWELSRHQFLVTAGLAYRTTGDEKYAEAFVSLIRSWMLANPPGFGINWASSLEAALRIVSWSWALFLFRGSGRVTEDLFEEMAAGIGAHASHIERYLSRHSSPNTHLTGEALGLFYAGVLFPENRLAVRWRAVGQAILEEQIHIQVLPDGAHFEQSTTYQRYTIEIYLHYLILAERNGIKVSTIVGERVQAMLDMLLALRRPDGGMPAIGDSDGGSLLPMVPRGPGDPRGLFATAAVHFGRADYAWAAEGLQPEALWFFGPRALERFASRDAAPPEGTSRAFVDGGYVVMRSGWSRDSHQLIFDAGPLGCPLTGGHGHADLLSVQVSPFGEPCIVDPGTYGYSIDPGLRSHFRGTSAHATVLVDGQGQAEPSGAFRWRQRPAARLRRFLSEPAFDFADGSHEAYSRFPDPVVHRRRVVFVRSPGYWVIADDLSGLREHRVELRFQFSPLPVVLLADSWVRAEVSGGRGLLLRAFSGVALAVRIAQGSTAPIEGWVSSDYGQREPAPLLVCSANARLPLRVITLLLPVSDRETVVPRMRPVWGPNGTLLGLTFEDTDQTIRFDSDTFTMGNSNTWKV